MNPDVIPTLRDHRFKHAWCRLPETPSPVILEFRSAFHNQHPAFQSRQRHVIGKTQSARARPQDDVVKLEHDVDSLLAFGERTLESKCDSGQPQSRWLEQF
jgi:hypothetical protein